MERYHRPAFEYDSDLEGPTAIWPPPDEVELWRNATTLAEVGELMARWLEGDISYRPGYGGAGADLETELLATFLAACNRAGFVTENSQPGEPITEGFGQRAWVEGFGAKETARRIFEVALPTDLIVICSPPGTGSDIEICITIDEGEMFTRTSGATPTEYVAQSWEGSVSDEALVEICDAWQICLVDAEWGRNSLLWTTIAAALNVPPPPDLLGS